MPEQLSGGACAFSVVIPAYNAAEFIETALDSVAAQTFPDYEVIVVDDGSSDHTFASAGRWATCHPGIRLLLLKQANQGPGAARNAALREARGTFVALLDADDAWKPGKLAAVARHLAAHPDLDLLSHDAAAWDGRLVRRYMRCGPHGSYEDLLFGGNCLFASASIARRARVVEAGGFSEDRACESCEDYDLWLRLAKAGCRIGYLHAAYTDYRVHPGSLTNRIDEHGENLCRVMALHFAGWQPKSLLYRYRMRRARAELFRTCAREHGAAGHYGRSVRYAARSLAENPFCWATHWRALCRRVAGIASVRSRHRLCAE